jgi:hypothetical protein
VSVPTLKDTTPSADNAWLIEALHLFPLWAFAFAQPLYNVLSGSPEFFVAHRIEATGLVALAIVVSLGIPLVLVFLETLVRQFSEWARWWLHRLLVTLLVIATALGSINLFLDSAPLTVIVPLSALSGLAIAVLYTWKAGFRRFFTILAPAALLFPLQFLLFSPVSELVLAKPEQTEAAAVQARTPIVFLVFDEFNPTALLKAEEQIDEIRFPNFAALADDSYWFPYATGTHYQTKNAVPAILTGREPGADLLPPTYSTYPDSIFTWLGNAYRLNVLERITSLCPPNLCDSTEMGDEFDISTFGSDLALVYAHIMVPPRHREQWLPPLDTGWKGFAGRPDASQRGPRSRNASVPTEYTPASIRQIGQFERFVSQIQGGKATLDYMHILVPHEPYRFLYDGTEYDAPIEGRKDRVWSDNKHLLALAYQRYLHQVGFADKLLGRIIARLKEVGKYTESMIIVTADHGVSFKPGFHKRIPSEDTAAAVFSIPLLIKLPTQTEGRVSERHVSNVDLLATIADVIGEDTPWETDGASVVASEFADREKIVAYSHDRTGLQEFDVLKFSSAEQLQWQLETFGAGVRLDRTGIRTRYSGLIGQDIEKLDPKPNAGGARLVSDDIQSLASVEYGSGLVPVIFNGNLENVAPGEQWVALALNEKIAAIAPAYQEGKKPLHVQTMFPKAALLDGQNTLEAFLVSGDEESPVLMVLDILDIQSYSLARTGNAEVIHSSSGKSYRITPKALQGSLGRLTRQKASLHIHGWAVDAKAGDLPENVLVQVNGDKIRAAEIRISRPGIAKRLGNDRFEMSGFRLVIPEFGQRSELRSIRVFLLSRKGYASEIPVRPEVMDAMEQSISRSTTQ